MKHNPLIILLLALLTTLPCLALTPRGNTVNPGQRGIRLTEAQRRTIEAVSGKSRSAMPGLPVGGSRLMNLPVKRNARGPLRLQTSTGSTLEGWRVPDYEETAGWFALDFEGNQELQWQYNGGVDEYGDPVAFPFNIGFYRDGKIYGIGSTMILYWAIVEHGIFTREGEMIDYTPTEDFAPDLSSYVFSISYDPQADKAYAFTLNADASGYMFQSIDPNTWQYTVINGNVALNDLCNGMAVNTRDGKLYGITPENKFVRVDPATGNLEVLANYTDLMPCQGCEAMVYSPYDDAFFYVVPDNYAYDTKLMRIDAQSYQYQECANLYGTVQYPILITPDQLVSADAPAMPVLQELRFNGGELNGKAVLTMPSTTFGGAALEDNLTVKATVDGTEVAAVQALAGATVTLDLPVAASGKHRFVFTVSNEQGQGPAVEQVRYIGFDTPEAPTDVVFTTEGVSWQPVTTTLHGGYLDTEALYYNVYVDKVKMNTEPIRATEYAMQIPASEFKKHIAAVEAVNHDLVSARTQSNGVVAGQALSLPYNAAPTNAQAELFQPITVGGNDWSRWSFNGSEFSCYTTSYNGDGSDEWLFLPPLDITDASQLVHVAADVRADGSEILAIAYGTTANPEEMTIAENFDNLHYEEAATTETWLTVPTAGTYYIAFKTTKKPAGQYIALNHFVVEASGIGTTAPAKVNNLTATAAPQGALKATVNFTLPTLNVGGTALDAAKEMTATIVSPAATATATGKPGASIQVEVATETGFNPIKVSVDGSVPATTKVYTGLDIPSPISVLNAECSADNLSMNISWEAPTTGINGGYVNPDEITYLLAQPADEYGNWQITDSLGTTRAISLGIKKQSQVLAKVGIVAQNASGYSNTFRSTVQSLGTPFSLPLIETFETHNPSVEPLFVEAADGYDTSIGTRDLGYDGSVRDGAVCLAMSNAYGKDSARYMVNMPKVSLQGAKHPQVELSVYCGPEAGKLTVTAESYGTDGAAVVLGSFQNVTDDKHMERIRFEIPAKFAAKNWTLIKLIGEVSGEEQVNISRIKVDDYLENDLAVTALETPQFMLTNQTYEVKVTVENMGLNAMALPDLNLEAVVDGKVVSTLPMTATGELQPMHKQVYTASYTPGVEDGNGDVCFVVKAATADDNAKNDSLSVVATVCRGNQPIVNDLKATATASGAQLTWTEPVIVDGQEGFENYAPYSYYDQLGDFTAIDRDGLEPTYVNVTDLPGAQAPKAWQVFSQSDITARLAGTTHSDAWGKAHSGDRMIVAFVPFSVWVGEGLEADDWLVSPQLVSGSTFSFYARPFDNGTENMEVLTSATSDPDSFALLQPIHPFGDSWTQFSFTLPEGHRYFAIRYVSNSDNGIGVCLDDLVYNRDGDARPQIVGYDILREGTVVAEHQPALGSWTDNGQGACYNVRPVLQDATGTHSGVLSNTAILGEPSAIKDIEAEGAATARYRLNGVRVDGKQRGVTITVSGKKARKELR